MPTNILSHPTEINASFTIGGTDNVAVTSTGNVGIGTTSPDTKLHVNVASTANYVINANDRLKVKGDGTLWWGSAADYGKLTWDTGKAIVRGESGKALSFGVDGGQDDMYINTSGNVGIGTTSPVQPLTVQAASNANTIALLGRSNDNNSRLDFLNSAGDSRIFTILAYDSANQIYGDTNIPLTISTNATERMRINADGNVGINTSAPGERLDVVGNIRSYSAANNYGQIQNGSFLAVGNHGGTFMLDLDNNGSADLVNIKKSGTSRFYIENGGNVGIGTTSPSANLEVAGAVKVTDSASGITIGGVGHASLRLNRASTSYDNNILFNTNGDTKFRIWQDGNADYLYIRDDDNATNMVTFKKGGNVGIGTTSPNEKLHVESDNDGHIAEFKGSGTNAGGRNIRIGVGNTDIAELPAYQPYIYASASDSANNSLAIVSEGGSGSTGGIDFYTGTNSAGTERRMRIDRSGNVGIGITSPSYKLDVNGASRIYGNAQALTVQGTDHVYIGWSPAGSRKAYAGFASAGSNSFTLMNEYAGSLILGTSGAEKMRIASDGNVGIGTTSPQALLDVRGKAKVGNGAESSDNDFPFTVAHDNYRTDAYGSTMLVRDNRAYNSTNNGGGILFGGLFNSTNGVSWWGKIKTTKDNTNDGDYAAHMSFFTRANGVGPAERMRITSDGNVGIGTTSPSQKLDVNGAVSTNGGKVVIRDDSFENHVTNGNASIVFNYNGYQTGTTQFRDVIFYNGKQGHIMTVDGSSSNVGIGTTSPNYKLDVSGEAQLGYINFEYNYNYPGIRWKDSAYNLQWKLGNDGPNGNWFYLYDYGMSASAFTFKQNGDMLFTPGGNVGIGTTSPDSTLHVSSTSPIITISNSDTSIVDGQVIGQVDFKSLDASTNMTAVFGSIRTQAQGTLDNGVNDGGKMVFSTFKQSTTLVDQMVIDADGNVGIGKTDPASKLHISDATDISMSTGGAGQFAIEGNGYTGAIALDATAMHIYHNSANRALVLGTNETAAITIHKNNQSLDFNAYGAGSFKGNALYNLGVDSSGNVVETSGNWFGTNTSNTYTNQWHNFLELSYSAFGSLAIKIHLRGHGNTSAQSLVGEVEFNFKNQNGTIRSRATVNSYGTTPISKDDIAIYFDTTNSKINFYWKVKENYTSPQYYIDGYVSDYIWKNTYIGDDTALAAETNDSITSNLKFQGITQDNDSGNVGIGTTAPGTLLQVGDGTSDESARVYHSDNTFTEVKGYGIQSNRSVVYFRPTGDKNAVLAIGADSHTWNYANIDTNIFRVLTDDNEHFRINSSGNVGIGTTSPPSTVLLDLKENTSTADLIIGLTAATGGRSQIRSVAQADNTTSEISFHTVASSSTSEAMRIDSSGNVGIGTTDPNTFLHIAGQGNRSGGQIYLGNKDDGSTKYGLITSAHYNAATEPEGFTLITGLSTATENTVSIGGFVWESNPATNIRFFTHTATTHTTGGSERMRITSSGNVGIGTTGPGAKLEVFGTGNTLRLDSAANGSKEILFRNVGTGTATIKTDGDLKLYVEDAGKNILFDTTGGEKMRITAAGNVGIGVTNPSQKLHIAGSSTDTGIRIDNTATDGRDWFLYSRASAGIKFSIYDFDATADRLGIDENGNVGIGTTSPTDKLTVAGVIKSIGGTNNGKFAQIYVNDSFAYYTTNASVIYMSSELQVNSGRIGSYDEDLSLETSGTTRITVSNSNGNVGIGTTAPQQALHIKGATNALMMLEGDNDNGIAGCYYKTEDTDDTMNRTKGFFGFTGNNIYGNGYFTMWLDNANDDGTVTASEERFRWERDGDFHADGDVIAYSTTTPSDIRLKTDVETIESASEKVSKLRGVEYTWSKGKLAGQREIGLIAQEVEAVVPEVVKEKELPLWDNSGESYKTVDYEKLVALLIESNKELQARVEQLENKLDGFTK